MTAKTFRAALLPRNAPPAPKPPAAPKVLTPEGKQTVRERGLVRRAEAARLVGVSVPTIAGYQRAGVLRAEQVEGVWYSTRADCLRLRTEREQASGASSRPSMTDAERAGTLARSAFELLSAGTPAAELVMKLGIEPARAKELVVAYQELRELAVVSRRAEYVACCRCGSNAARVCSECSGHANAAHAG